MVLIQDADLEYDPHDYFQILKHFSDPSVKAVYGSRLTNYPLNLFGPNKTPMPVHLVANRFLTFLRNILYGSSLTDMETCYKAIDRDLLMSLHLQAKRFDFEPEVTAKILKKGTKITEVPIKVSPRSYDQGKKIGWRDGLSAVLTLLRYRFTD